MTSFGRFIYLNTHSLKHLKTRKLWLSTLWAFSLSPLNEVQASTHDFRRSFLLLMARVGKRVVVFWWLRLISFPLTHTNWCIVCSSRVFKSIWAPALRSKEICVSCRLSLRSSKAYEERSMGAWGLWSEEDRLILISKAKDLLCTCMLWVSVFLLESSWQCVKWQEIVDYI